MRGFIKLTPVDTSMHELSIRKKDINAVYIKDTVNGKVSIVVVGSMFYMVKESKDSILKLLNRWL